MKTKVTFTLRDGLPNLTEEEQKIRQKIDLHQIPIM